MSLLFPLDFRRQYSGPLDEDLVFDTIAEKDAYLSSPRRYAGQIVSCLEEEGKTFVLNNDEDGWIETSSSDDVLLLDQTTPQTVLNGKPIFDSGVSMSDDSDISGKLTVSHKDGFEISCSPLTIGGINYDQTFTSTTSGTIFLYFGMLSTGGDFDPNIVDVAESNAPYFLGEYITGNNDVGVACLKLTDSISSELVYLTLYFPSELFLGETNPSPGTDDLLYLDTWLAAAGDISPYSIDYYCQVFLSNTSTTTNYVWDNPDTVSIATGYTTPVTINYTSVSEDYVELDYRGVNVKSGGSYFYEDREAIKIDWENSNVFFGGSGNKTMTGSYNFAMSQASLQSNITGEWNTAIGVGSLYSNTAGSWNTAIGKQTLGYNEDGSNNIAIGDSSLFRNTSGWGNLAIGNYATYQNQGSSNVAIGYEAGRELLNGHGNVFIGNGADIVAGATEIDHAISIGNGILVGADYAQAFGGQDNVLDGVGSVTVSGNTLVNHGLYCNIFSGLNNTISATSEYSTILAGQNNAISGNLSSILGGSHTTNDGLRSVISGGQYNTITSGANDSFIAGGVNNVIGATGNYTNIIGGLNSYASDFGSTIIGSIGANATNSGFIANSQDSVVNGFGALSISNLSAHVTGTCVGAIESDYVTVVADYSSMIDSMFSSIEPLPGGASITKAFMANSMYCTINTSSSCILSAENSSLNGIGSGILGGQYNVINATNSFILGGHNNTESGNLVAIIDSVYSSASGYFSSVYSSLNSDAIGDGSFILNSSYCDSSGWGAAIYSSTRVTNNANFSTCVDSVDSTMHNTAFFSYMANANFCNIYAPRSAVLGGSYHTITNAYNTIVGGNFNTITGMYNYALGEGLTMTGNNSFGISLEGYLKGIISTATFTGTGLDDATASGTYYGSDLTSVTYTVQISADSPSSAIPDRFIYKKDDGSWSSPIDIDAAGNELEDGVIITFAATSGHTVGDEWAITVTPVTPTIMTKSNAFQMNWGSTYIQFEKGTVSVDFGGGAIDLVFPLISPNEGISGIPLIGIDGTVGAINRDMANDSTGENKYSVINHDSVSSGIKAVDFGLYLNGDGDHYGYFSAPIVLLEPDSLPSPITYYPIRAGADSAFGNAYSTWTFGSLDLTALDIGYIPTLTPAGSVLGNIGVIYAQNIYQFGIEGTGSTIYSLGNTTLGDKVASLEYVWSYTNDYLWIDTSIQLYDVDDPSRETNFTIGENDITTSPYLRLYGFLTATSDAKYVEHQIQDADDYLHLSRSTADILGYKIDMPVDIGGSSSDEINHIGRMIVRTLGSDPKDATPGNRPAGSVAEIAFYNGKMYFCTNDSTPTWELITSS